MLVFVCIAIPKRGFICNKDYYKRYAFLKLIYSKAEYHIQI